MSVAKLPPIVRPMDPEFIAKLLESQKVDTKLINGIVSAIGKYNVSCTKAADKLLLDLKNLKKGKNKT